MSPKRSQVSPLNFISCNCEIGAKSDGLVLIFTPGSFLIACAANFDSKL